jgi:hypothetical protein
VNKKTIAGKLQGGLGNQLFILAATWEQANRLNCGFEIDTQLYDGSYDRSIEIDLVDFPGKLGLVNSGSPRTLLPQLLQNRLPNVYKESSFQFEERINSITPGTTLVGYFQSERYFPTIGKQLADSIADASLRGEHAGRVESFNDRSFIALHVRRGDYVSNPEATAVHGVTSINFFRKSLELASLLYPGLEVIVFSDSPKEVKEEFAELSDLVFEPALEPLSSLETLRVMSLAKCLIISNSTFSWWAAWLNNILGDQAHVIAPRPWFENDNNTNDLLPSHWITLGK